MIRLRWAAAITVGADEKIRKGVYKDLKLSPVAQVSKCFLRSQNTRVIVRKGLIIELVFPLDSGEALDGRELNDLCAKSVFEMIGPNRDIQQASAIPKPARGEPVFSRGALSLGLGSMLAVEDKPFTLPNTRNLDILIFEALKGPAGKDSELIVRIPCYLLFRFDSAGAYTFTWRSGQVKSKPLVLEVER